MIALDQIRLQSLGPGIRLEYFEEHGGLHVNDALVALRKKSEEVWWCSFCGGRIEDIQDRDLESAPVEIEIEAIPDRVLRFHHHCMPVRIELLAPRLQGEIACQVVASQL